MKRRRGLHDNVVARSTPPPSTRSPFHDGARTGRPADMEIIGLDQHERESQLSIGADDRSITDRRTRQARTSIGLRVLTLRGWVLVVADTLLFERLTLKFQHAHDARQTRSCRDNHGPAPAIPGGRRDGRSTGGQDHSRCRGRADPAVRTTTDDGAARDVCRDHARIRREVRGTVLRPKVGTHHQFNCATDSARRPRPHFTANP